MPKNQEIHPPLLAASMPLFPTLGSMQEVLEFSESCLPIMTKNDLHILLMTYQNTLIKELSK